MNSVKNKLNMCQDVLSNSIFDTMVEKIENMELDGYFTPSEVISRNEKLSDLGKVYNSSYLDGILKNVESRLYYNGYKCNFTQDQKRVDYVVRVFDIRMYMAFFVLFFTFMTTFIGYSNFPSLMWDKMISHESQRVVMDYMFE
jgi:hypothetical protein